MVNFIIVSNIFLWVCVVSLILIVLMLLRQVGVLFERVAPAGALMINKVLSAGEKAPEMLLTDLINGHQIQVAGQKKSLRSQLLFFVDSKCPVCKTLLPAIQSASKTERSWLDVILAGDADDNIQKEFLKRYELLDFEFINSTTLGKSYGVSKLPYAVLLDEKGIISSMGIINSREHLESLFEAKERGVASIQTYMSEKALEYSNAVTGEK